MRKFFKTFMVISLGLHLGDGWWHHFLLSTDGVCFRTVRHRQHPDLVPWDIGQIINVPLVIVETAKGDREAMPDWDAVDVPAKLKINLRYPYETVARFWGPDVAATFLDPTPLQKA